MKQLFYFFIALLFTAPVLVNAQKISGTVKSSDGPLIGASVSAGPGVGATTDVDGKYSIALSAGSYTITVNYIGYIPQTRVVTLGQDESKILDVSLVQDAVTVGDVVIVGTRTMPRSNVSNPVPVDILVSKDLQSTGQQSFDKALQYRIPSFNTVQTPVNDATSLLDPYEIRNMGPSRTLILINGKRKNLSALIYTQTSPGRGETGADISAIPVDAIKRVEILRDGASAQYGSDAIAGVMNIILKDNIYDGSATLRGGITSQGDGEMIGFSVNNGAKVTDKGFINYTVDISKVGLANRPGTVSPEGDALYWGNGSMTDVQTFLKKRPDAGNINGSPETTSSKFLVNGGLDLDENTELYYDAAYVYKKVNSFANYRTPYWRSLAGDPYLKDIFPSEDGSYQGYVPTFDGDLNDYNATFGLKKVLNGWNTDVSFTTGGNTQRYTVTNSVNRSTIRNPSTYLGDLNSNGVVDANELIMGTYKYRENSQIAFRAGGTRFSHNVGNIDISKVLSEKISIGFGTEFRSETFDLIEGDVASYEGGGADSYAGNSAENSFKSNRYNLGGYFDLAYDVTKNFLLNGTARAENYSDFGSAFVWKISTRYKLADDKVTLRASYSTGFRAPTLHQIYTQRAQYSFVPGKGIQVEGLVNNVSPQAKVLGIPHLEPEKSTNISVGIGAKPNTNLSITLDYYNITVIDRIALSNQIKPTGDTTGKYIALDQILKANNIVSLYFFANALDSRTSGIDAVANYKNITLGAGSLGFTMAANYTLQNERIGEVKNPKVIIDANNSDKNTENDQTLVGPTQEALMFTSRPKFKVVFGIDYDIKKFSFILGNTVFGPTTFRQTGLDKNLECVFKTKVVTDLGINFSANEKISIALTINNILNIVPEWELVALNPDGEKLLSDNTKQPGFFGLTNKQFNENEITFNQRYSMMTYDGSHFSQLGTIINLAINVKL